MEGEVGGGGVREQSRGKKAGLEGLSDFPQLRAAETPLSLDLQEEGENRVNGSNNR